MIYPESVYNADGAKFTFIEEHSDGAAMYLDSDAETVIILTCFTSGECYELFNEEITGERYVFENP